MYTVKENNGKHWQISCTYFIPNFDNDGMKSSKRQVTFLSFIFLLRCFAKSTTIKRNLGIVKLAFVNNLMSNVRGCYQVQKIPLALK